MQTVHFSLPLGRYPQRGYSGGLMFGPQNGYFICLAEVG